MSLPPEVVDRIIDYCYNDRSTLMQVSLTSHVYLQSARFHLFSDINITFFNAFTLYSILSTAHPFIPHSITNLSVDLSTGSDNIAENTAWAQSFAKCAEYFHTASGTLSLGFVDFDQIPLRPVLLRGGGFDGYRSLTISGTRTDHGIRQLLVKSPQLEMFTTNWGTQTQINPIDKSVGPQMSTDTYYKLFPPLKTIRIIEYFFPSFIKELPISVWGSLKSVELWTYNANDFIQIIIPQLRTLSLSGMFPHYDFRNGIMLEELNITAIAASSLEGGAETILMPPRLRVFRYALGDRGMAWDSLKIIDVKLSSVASLERAEIIVFRSGRDKAKASALKKEITDEVEQDMPSCKERGVLKIVLRFDVFENWGV